MLPSGPNTSWNAPKEPGGSITWPTPDVDTTAQAFTPRPQRTLLQNRSSDPRAKYSGLNAQPGSGYSVIAPLPISIRAILLLKPSTNQTFPSAPLTMPAGKLTGVGTEYRTIGDGVGDGVDRWTGAGRAADTPEPPHAVKLAHRATDANIVDLSCIVTTSIAHRNVGERQADSFMLHS